MAEEDRKTPLRKSILRRVLTGGPGDGGPEDGNGAAVPRRSIIRKGLFRRTRSNASASSDNEGSDGEEHGNRRRRKIFHGSLLRRDTSRDDHLRTLVQARKASTRYVTRLMTTQNQDGDRSEDLDLSTDIVLPSNDSSVEVKADLHENLKDSSEWVRSLIVIMHEYNMHVKTSFPIEIRMNGLTYKAPVRVEANKIRTVYNSSIVYDVVKFFKNFGGSNRSAHTETQVILEDISVKLKPGKMYLVLGAPRSGKSTFLKAMSGRLSFDKGESCEGEVTYNGKSFDDKTKFHIENAIAFIDQLDRHAPRLTVNDTFEFAYQCKRGGVQTDSKRGGRTDETKKFVAKADRERIILKSTMEALGLTHVKDTFVGDDEIRGVSGGQRRRVTVGEMLMDSSPILCGDAISNGLDAASTYDMVQILTTIGRIQKQTRAISLLQPSPETVSLFDDVILLAEGKLLYAGPISDVEDYFASLGYKAPSHMDVADFLQLLATPDAEALFDPPTAAAEVSKYHTAQQLAIIFKNSSRGKSIKDELMEPYRNVWGSARGDVEECRNVRHLDDSRFQKKYANSFLKSTLLNIQRNLTLWIRDKRVLRANATKNIIMGISVGGVFFQTDDVISILGVLFQGMLFIMLGAMTNAPAFVDERSIYYKHADANFFPACPFVVGKALSRLPQTTMDCTAFGVILYFMVGLASTVENFLVFLALIILFSTLMNEFLFVFSTVSRTKPTVQVVGACLVFFCILFCGFIIAPNTIPVYYSWIYWWNPLAWAYRALVLNEYRSSRYTEEEGDRILTFSGFTDIDGNPFGAEWIGYSFIYMILHTLISMGVSTMCLRYIRPKPDSVIVGDVAGATNSGRTTNTDIRVPFKPVTLSFEDITYDVKASTSNEQLRLLTKVSGVLKPGRMCALMGSSGAGKTTLLDVISLRKTTGTIQGEVRLNGFLQEPVAFRRCSGYVEQFDVQSPQLTVRETVLFSARLRLDPQQIQADEEKQKFCDGVLAMLELTSLAECLVGSDDEGGLSFEQKKRLSIAVELAASPSVLFLDEPTTGLDARSALVVVKLLRKIADQGRTICATIHQPSSQIFESFDDLILLKKGGVITFCGDLGRDSQNLIDFFEGHGAANIALGDNSANWMLREISREDAPDFEKAYQNSLEYVQLKACLEDIKEQADPSSKITFPTVYAAPADERQRLVNKRLQTIYWRSPSYNLSRLLVCSVIAFILGSVFLTNRNPRIFEESEVRAWLSVTFLCFIIIGILSITSVLPVMLKIRDIFYRHRTAGMLDNMSLSWALGTAEKWFIVLSSFFFCLVFLGVSAQSSTALRRIIRFWGIFTFNLAIYSYFGQAFMCCVGNMTTAQILASVFIGLNNFFSGLIVRPQFLTGFFSITYWITPGHYVYEGLVLAQFLDDERPVIAVNGSEFYEYLECETIDQLEFPCNGTVHQYVDSFFGGRFHRDHQLLDVLVLTFYLLAARLLTFYALKNFNFSNT